MTAKGNPRQGLFGATLGFFAGFAAVSLFGPTASRFQEVMDLTPVMVGLLVAVPALSGSLLRIPFGAWVDTTGGRRGHTRVLEIWRRVCFPSSCRLYWVVGGWRGLTWRGCCSWCWVFHFTISPV